MRSTKKVTILEKNNFEKGYYSGDRSTVLKKVNNFEKRSTISKKWSRFMKKANDFEKGKHFGERSTILEKVNSFEKGKNI